MAVTLECKLKVSLREFRAAVAAVVPHAERTKTGDEISQLARVRVTAGKGELLLAATNTSTTARAAVTIDEDSRDELFSADDGIFSVDLPPVRLKKTVGAFEIGRPAADQDDAWAEITLTPGMLTIHDGNGLLPGAESSIPTLDLSDQFPDVAGVLQRAAASANASPQVKPLIAAKGPLALFNHAYTAYKRPLVFKATGTAGSRGWVVACGGKFVGVLSSEDPGGDSLGRMDAEWHEHLSRLGLDKPALTAV